jgi:hypothetical protein
MHAEKTNVLGSNRKRNIIVAIPGVSVFDPVGLV